MTSKEFVLWLKGFTEGVHEYNITPKQWDLLKEKLEEVDKFVETPGMFQVHPEKPYPGVPIGEGGWGTPTTTPNWQWPHYTNPLDTPYKITCTPGTTNIGTITTTPGYGSITTYNPAFSGSYNPSTTYVNPQSGSWSYTNTLGGNNIKD